MDKVLRTLSVFCILLLINCTSIPPTSLEKKSFMIVKLSDLMMNPELYYSKNIETEGILSGYYLTDEFSYKNCYDNINSKPERIVVRNKKINVQKNAGKWIAIRGFFEKKDSVTLGFPEDISKNGHGTWYLEASAGTGLVGIFENVELVSVDKKRNCSF